MFHTQEQCLLFTMCQRFSWYGANSSAASSYCQTSSSDNEGRIVNILLDIDDHILNIVNVYAPNKDCERGVFFTT